MNAARSVSLVVLAAVFILLTVLSGCVFPRWQHTGNTIQAQQVKMIERTLVPIVQAAITDRGSSQALALQMVQIIELLEQLGARLGNGRPRE